MPAKRRSDTRSSNGPPISMRATPTRFATCSSQASSMTSRAWPEQRYDDICPRLKRALGDEARSWTYAQPDIKEILVFGDMAVVRLTWTSTVTGGAEGDVKSVEPGMDIFRRQPDGGWKIMRYMAYSRGTSDVPARRSSPHHFGASGRGRCRRHRRRHRRRLDRALPRRERRIGRAVRERQDRRRAVEPQLGLVPQDGARSRARSRLPSKSCGCGRA